MKKIDRLLLTSFVSPFLAAFLIAVFVLLMQSLWLYIDELAGKGLGILLVVELLAYKCVALFPLALPIAILIATVMVMGNMAEHYELSSLKSAGVPLLRTMRPLIFAGFLTALFSYYCADYLMPVANLKFGSRMYDIQKQKPALRLEAGVFNYDFQGYAIHIGSKGGGGRDIRDVLVYDHSMGPTSDFTQIVADNGEMFVTEDEKFFVMLLRDGYQYIETRPGRSSSRDQHPFVRTRFDEWIKVFNLEEFELSRTDEALFRSNRSMMSISELRGAVDSLSQKILKRSVGLSNYVSNYFYFQDADSTLIRQREARQAEADQVPDGVATAVRSASEAARQQEAEEKAKRKHDADATAPATKTIRPAPVDKGGNRRRGFVRYSGVSPVEQKPDRPLTELDNLGQTFPDEKLEGFYNRAQTYARGILNQADSAIRFLESLKESRVKHLYELHTKYSMAVVCIIFVFIGAPMGAIVRKGGFGYPILISIIFFMLFVILTIFCRKIAESFVLPAPVAAWLPCMVLLPIGLRLTQKAMNDSKLLDVDRYTRIFSYLFQKIKKDAPAKSTNV